ncbi:hypothetical protein LMG8520_2467 [Lactococcus lactis subsp. lactis]|uniref:Uncharacterized protein n=2 Tax=Lactococcus lactis TaxID=1358 RepID=A0A2A5SLB7_LACLH|nr:hypothetical protein LMG8520_2467 [Lactococcus lactis subsp. lactis]PCS14272.1 hypothetical protein RU90_GL000104 [Lactococcus lactis subsp. hordniae]
MLIRKKTGPPNKPKPAPKPIEVPKAPKSKDDSSKKFLDYYQKLV